MKRFRYHILWTVALSLIFSACGGKGSDDNEEHQLDEDQIAITPEQFKGGDMAVGTLTMQSFAEEVSCRGYLTAPANAMAKVSTPVAGAVQSVHFKLGEQVRRGQTLCTISGNEFLGLQQQYAEATAQFQKAKADYDRMKALQAENIGAKKDYLTAESLYRSSLASYNALRARIQALNINPQRIENGQMYSAFPVVAPISGYVTGSGAVVGQYIDMSFEIAEVVDVHQLQLRLSVFDADIARLSIGQNVNFALSSQPDEIMSATLITIGKAINPETKSIDCIAQIKEEYLNRLVSDSYVEANIEVHQKEAQALPISAVQKEGDNYFVYLAEEGDDGSYHLTRTEVKVGSSSKEFIEILSGLSDDAQVLTRGIATL